jgi:hypothetical protein
MSKWRDHKAKARAAIHRNFGVPAVYLSHAAGTPVRCEVRIHSKVNTVQNEFTWPSVPGYLEIDPYVIFKKDQVALPLSNSFLIVSNSEVYKLGVSEPSREGYIKTMTVEMKSDEIEALLLQIDTETEAYEGII